MNDELEGIWKEAVMAKLQGTMLTFIQMDRKNTENLDQDSWPLGRD
jgi:hypothetical protein